MLETNKLIHKSDIFAGLLGESEGQDSGKYSPWFSDSWAQEKDFSRATVRSSEWGEIQCWIGTNFSFKSFVKTFPLRVELNRCKNSNIAQLELIWKKNGFIRTRLSSRFALTLSSRARSWRLELTRSSGDILFLTGTASDTNRNRMAWLTSVRCDFCSKSTFPNQF